MLQPLDPARAQSSDGQIELERGNAAMSSGRFEAAAAAFEASYRLNPTVRALYQLAVAYAAMGQPQRALSSYESYLRYADPKADAQSIETARREMLEAAASSFAIMSDMPSESML